MRAHVLTLCALVTLLGGSGCCPDPYGRLSGEWVLVARGQGAAGVAAAPQSGLPLEVQDAQAGCFASATLDQHFGGQCESHETEGGGGSDMTGDVPLGNNPTPGEVRWYCTGRGVLRVVLARCGNTDTFRVTELAVALHPE